MGATGEARGLWFEDAWPAVEPRLRRVLAARRVPVADHDDYLQEVALRVLASDTPLETHGDLLRWASAVLRNLHIDALRVGGRYRLEPDPSDQPTRDIAVQVAARMDLAAVAQVMTSWSPEDRHAVLSGVASDARQSNATYIRRHRLRLRLLAAIDGLAAWWVGLWRRVNPSDGDRAANAPILLPPTALACAVTITAALYAGQGAGAALPPPSEARPAAPRLAPEATALGASTPPLPAQLIDRGMGVDGVDERAADTDPGSAPDEPGSLPCVTDAPCLDVGPAVDGPPSSNAGSSVNEDSSNNAADMDIQPPDTEDLGVHTGNVADALESDVDATSGDPRCDGLQDPSRAVHTGPGCPVDGGLTR